MSVKPVTQSRIRGILDDLHFRHSVNNGGFLVILAADDDVPYDVHTVYKYVEDANRLSILCYGEKEIEAQRRGEAVMACNEWNIGHSWPKAHYRDSDASIWGSTAFDLEHGVHDELLKMWIKDALGYGWAMFKHFASKGL